MDRIHRCWDFCIGASRRELHDVCESVGGTGQPVTISLPSRRHVCLIGPMPSLHGPSEAPRTPRSV